VRTNSPGSSVKITNPDVSVSGSAAARGTTQNIARITHKSDLRRILPPAERLHAYREPPRMDAQYRTDHRASCTTR
jgi:hypothetical protein